MIEVDIDIISITRHKPAQRRPDATTTPERDSKTPGRQHVGSPVHTVPEIGAGR